MGKTREISQFEAATETGLTETAVPFQNTLSQIYAGLQKETGQ